MMSKEQSPTVKIPSPALHTLYPVVAQLWHAGNRINNVAKAYRESATDKHWPRVDEAIGNELLALTAGCLELQKIMERQSGEIQKLKEEKSILARALHVVNTYS